MASPITPIDLTKITTYSVKDRKSKVNARDFSKPWIAGGSFARFLSSLPAILAGNDLVEVIQAISQAKIDNAPICLAMGAHVIKVGLNPILIDLMERGLISMLSMNGAGIIHDLEVALNAKTSEDVAASIGDGGSAWPKKHQSCSAGRLKRRPNKKRVLAGLWGISSTTKRCRSGIKA